MNRPRQLSVFTTTDVPESAINTETLVSTLVGVTSEFPNQSVVLQAWVDWLPGTTATGVILRVRRDSLTGTLVSEANTDAAAAAQGQTPMIQAVDSRPGEFAGNYVLTVAGVGETAVGNARSSSIVATVS